MTRFNIESALIFPALRPEKGLYAVSARDAALRTVQKLRSLQKDDLPFDLIVRETARSKRSARRFRVRSKSQLQELRACRVCGCAEDDACDFGCFWAGADLCSTCEATP